MSYKPPRKLKNQLTSPLSLKFQNRDLTKELKMSAGSPIVINEQAVHHLGHPKVLKVKMHTSNQNMTPHSVSYQESTGEILKKLEDPSLIEQDSNSPDVFKKQTPLTKLLAEQNFTADGRMKEHPPKQLVQLSSVFQETNSQQIFNLRQSDNRNMLLNQDKYQNPVNKLSNKFDIASGPSGRSVRVSSMSDRKLFGHTPIAGPTFEHNSRNRVAKIKKSLGVRLEHSESTFEIQPKQKSSMKKSPLPPHLGHFEPLGNLSKNQSKSRITGTKDSPTKLSTKSKQGSPLASANTTQNMQQILGTPGGRQHIAQFSQEQLQTTMPSIQMANNTHHFESQGLHEDFLNRQWQSPPYHLNSTVLAKPKKGFQIQDKNFNTRIILNKTADPYSSTAELLHKLAHTSDPVKKEQIKLLLKEQENLNNISQNLLTDQVSKQIKAGRHDEINKSRINRFKKVSPPQEYLSRHPNDFKHLRSHCKEIRQRDPFKLPSMGKYLYITPTELSMEDQAAAAAKLKQSGLFDQASFGMSSQTQGDSTFQFGGMNSKDMSTSKEKSSRNDVFQSITQLRSPGLLIGQTDRGKMMSLDRMKGVEPRSPILKQGHLNTVQQSLKHQQYLNMQVQQESLTTSGQNSSSNVNQKSITNIEPLIMTGASKMSSQLQKHLMIDSQLQTGQTSKSPFTQIPRQTITFDPGAEGESEERNISNMQIDTAHSKESKGSFPSEEAEESKSTNPHHSYIYNPMMKGIGGRGSSTGESKGPSALMQRGGGVSTNMFSYGDMKKVFNKQIKRLTQTQKVGQPMMPNNVNLQLLQSSMQSSKHWALQQDAEQEEHDDMQTSREIAITGGEQSPPITNLGSNTIERALEPTEAVGTTDRLEERGSLPTPGKQQAATPVKPESQIKFSKKTKAKHEKFQEEYMLREKVASMTLQLVTGAEKAPLNTMTEKEKGRASTLQFAREEYEKMKESEAVRIRELKEKKFHKIGYSQPPKGMIETLGSKKNKIVTVYNQTIKKNEWANLPYKIKKAEEMKEQERLNELKKKERIQKLIEQKKMERKIQKKEIRHQMGLDSEDSNEEEENTEDLDLPPINTREPPPGSIVFRPAGGFNISTNESMDKSPKMARKSKRAGDQSAGLGGILKRSKFVDTTKKKKSFVQKMDSEDTSQVIGSDMGSMKSESFGFSDEEDSDSAIQVEDQKNGTQTGSSPDASTKYGRMGKIELEIELNKVKNDFNREHAKKQQKGKDKKKDDDEDSENHFRFREEEVNYFKIFFRQENKMKMKYMIYEDTHDIIAMIDDIIHSKKEKEKEEQLKKFETLRSLSGGDDLDLSKIRKLGRAGTSSVSPLVSSKSTTKTPRQTMNFQSQQKQIQFTEDGGSMSMSPSRRFSKLSTRILKQMPAIVQEVVTEFYQDNTSAKRGRKNCSCSVKETLKRYIRHVRDFGGNRENFKAYLTNEMRQNICSHDFEDDLKEEKQLAMMKVFEEFYTGFQTDRYKVKISKPMMFKSFIKQVLAQQEPAVEELQKFIQDNNLMKGLVEYADFHQYNKYMALKMKKKDKLQAEDLPKIRIDTSDDSSIDSSDSMEDAIGKEKDIKIYDPQLLRASADMDEVEHNILGLNINKKIYVNEKVFKNFLGPMVGGEQELARLASERFSIEKEEEAMAEAQKHFEATLLSSFSSVLKSMRHLKKMIDDQEVNEQRKKFQSSANVTKKVNKHVDIVKAALENSLGNQIKVTENAKMKEVARQQAAKQNQTMQQQQMQEKARRMTEESPAHQRLTNKSMIDQRLKQEKKKRENQIKLFTGTQNSIKFYQNGKNLIDNPQHKCLERYPIIASSYMSCVTQGLMPRPHYGEMLRNNNLIIRDTPMSKEMCLSLKEVILEGERQASPEMEVHNLLIDNYLMTDEQVAIILDAVKSQDFLKTITLKGCEVQMQSIRILNDILEKQYPNNIDDLRIINTKNTDRYIDNLRELTCQVRNQNQIKVLQLSELNLNDYYIMDDLYELIASDTHLKEVDLSNSKVNLKYLDTFVDALNQNENLKAIKLRGITSLQLSQREVEQYNELVSGLGMTAEKTPQFYRIEFIEQILTNLIEFIENSQSLVTLDLSMMGLQPDTLIRISNAIVKSASIMSVHLSGNHMPMSMFSKICNIFQVDYQSLGDKIVYQKQPLTDQQLQIQMKDVIQEDVIKEEENAQPKKEHTVSAMAAERAQNPEFMNILQHEVKRNMKVRIDDQKDLRNHLGWIQSEEMVSQLVFYRKFIHPELIFNEMIQGREFERVKHFDFNSFRQLWQLRFKDEQCYICNRYQQVNFFFRTCRADTEFKRIDDEQEVAELKLKHNVRGLQKNDPFERFPLFFSSMMDPEIRSMRMIPVKMQAALMHGLTEAEKKKTSDQARQYFEKYLKGIKNLMKADFSKISQEDVDHINLYFSCWRDFILNDPRRADIELENINTPPFIADQTNEDDIFMYSGFVRPGVHNALIYSPSEDCFFEMTNIAIFPSKGDLKQIKKHHVNRFDDEEDEKLSLFKGHLYKMALSETYGLALKDNSNRVAQFCFHYDTNDRVLNLSKYVGKETSPESVLQVLRQNYKAVIKAWKLLHMHNFSASNFEAEVNEIKFSKSMEMLFSSFDLFSAVSKSDLDQTFKIVFDQFQKDLNYTKTKQEMDEYLKEHKFLPIDNAATFSRRMFVACLVRVAQLIFERSQKKKRNGLELKSLPITLNHMLSQGLTQHLTIGDCKNDLPLLREKVIYDNKRLTALLKENKELIKSTFYEPLLAHDDNSKINVDSELYQMRKKRFQPKGFHMMIFSLQKSLPKFADLIQAIPEIKDKITDSKLAQSPKTQLITLLLSLATQSQVNVLNEDQMGQALYRSLTFEEFLIFLINLALYIELKVEVDATIPIEQTLETEEDQKEDAPAAEGAPEEAKEQVKVEPLPQTTIVLVKARTKRSHLYVLNAVQNFLQTLFDAAKPSPLELVVPEYDALFKPGTQEDVGETFGEKRGSVGTVAEWSEKSGEVSEGTEGGSRLTHHKKKKEDDSSEFTEGYSSCEG